MAISRRNLLRLPVIFPLGFLSGNSLAVKRDGQNLALRQVMDDHAAPVFKQGDLLLVDPSCVSFKGDGYYLYPHWGQPAPYFVTRKSKRLYFHRPGHQQALWSITDPHNETRFAADILQGNIPEVQAAVYPQLKVEKLPS